MTEVGVVILGAGPAGAAAALTLAPRYRVLLIDRRGEPGPRIGESLIPAARRLLRDMRVLEAFEAEGHAAYLGNRSIWGGAAVQEVDFLCDPDGHGWHLERRRFECFLRSAAQQRGARLIAPARLRTVTRDGGRWNLGIEAGGETQSVTARILIDACGRSAPLAKRLSAARVHTDRLVAYWLCGTADREDGASAGFSLVESEPDGWWYTAPVPGVDGRPGRVLAFHTDNDLAVSRPRDVGELLDRARRRPGIAYTLARLGFSPVGRLGKTAANSAYLTPAAGPGWLAIGDAAISFDPLSSCGLFNALYTAMTGAIACHDQLQSVTGDLIPYIDDLARIRVAYDRHMAVTYAAETRWANRPFWARRGAT